MSGWVNRQLRDYLAGWIVSARSRLGRCPGCGGRADDNWFDRSLCSCGAMHTRCRNCGVALDDCVDE